MQNRENQTFLQQLLKRYTSKVSPNCTLALVCVLGYMYTQHCIKLNAKQGLSAYHSLAWFLQACLISLVEAVLRTPRTSYRFSSPRFSAIHNNNKTIRRCSIFIAMRRPLKHENQCQFKASNKIHMRTPHENAQQTEIFTEIQDSVVNIQLWLNLYSN